MRYSRHSVRDYRSYSFWLDTVPEDLSARPSLEAPLHADVAIVGAGYTGLWTSYYLAEADPALKIVVLEPIPTPSERTVTSAKSAFALSPRSA